MNYIVDFGEIVLIQGLLNNASLNGKLGRITGVKGERLIVTQMEDNKMQVLVKVDNIIDASIEYDDGDEGVIDDVAGRDSSDDEEEMDDGSQYTESFQYDEDEEQPEQMDFEDDKIEVNDIQKGNESDALEHAEGILAGGDFINGRKVFDALIASSNISNSRKIKLLLKFASVLGSYNDNEGELLFLQTALKLYPSSATIHSKLGGYYLYLNDIEGAFNSFQTASSFNPKWAAIRLHLAKLHLLRNQQADAITQLTFAINKCADINGDESPDRAARVYTLIGSLLHDLDATNANSLIFKSYLRAINICDRLTRGNESASNYELITVHSNAYYFLGNKLSNFGLKLGAIECYRLGLSIEPNDINTLLALGTTIRTKLGTVVTYENKEQMNADLVECISIYKQALKIDETNPNVYRHLGSVYMQKGDIADALAYFLKSLNFSSLDDPILPQINIIIEQLKEKLQQRKNGQIIVDV